MQSQILGVAVTILIAVALRDAVLLMADGRRQNSIRVISDEAEKIVPLRANLMLGVSGAEIGTSIAAGALQQCAANEAGDLIEQMKGLAFDCANHVVSLIDPATRSQAHVKVGLLTAGFDSASAFIAGALYGDGMQSADSILVRPEWNAPQFSVVGGESVGAQADFHGRLSRVIDEVVQYPATNARALSVLISTAEATIRSAAQYDATIGGRIQYRVIQIGVAAQYGFL